MQVGVILPRLISSSVFRLAKEWSLCWSLGQTKLGQAQEQEFSTPLFLTGNNLALRNVVSERHLASCGRQHNMGYGELGLSPLHAKWSTSIGVTCVVSTVVIHLLPCQVTVPVSNNCINRPIY
jgi:hypothetical protein